MTVGVSGHQKLPSNSVAWVRNSLRNALLEHRVSKGVSCLAAGTDQLFALAVLELGLKLEAVIPCDNYSSAFPDESTRATYSDLLRRASSHCRLPFTAPSEEAFLRGGERVVDLADLMLFVWSGNPAAGRGGTADIVNYAVSKNVPFIHINPSTLNVAASESL